MEWKDVILHPVLIILRKDGALEPGSFTEVNSDILDQYEQETISSGNPESYTWMFEKVIGDCALFIINRID